MKRFPPPVPFIRDEDDDIPKLLCPVAGCDAYGSNGDEPDCEHEYPGRCVACDTVVGNRFTDLAWFGVKLSVDQWLCERCRGYCEACDGEGLITFDGVCGACMRVVAADGAVVWEGEDPVLELRLGDEPGWVRLEES